MATILHIDGKKMSNDEQPARRRRRRSSSGMSFGGAGLSSSSTAEGADIDASDDDVDRDLNAEVESHAAAQARLTEPEDRVFADEHGQAEEEFTPENRMREVGQRDSKYHKEYRLKLLHRMLLRSVPLDKIADELNLSISQVRRDRAQLFKRIREEASHLDVNQLVGDSVGFYNEVMSMALRTASASKIPVNLKLAAMRTSLSARNDMHRFLQAAGVYDVLRYRAAEEGAENEDISKMLNITKAVLGMDDDSSVEDIKNEFSLDNSELGEDEYEEDDIRVL